MWLSDIPLITKQPLRGQVVNAQTADANNLVNQGVNYYESGNFQSAINQWLEALKIYQNTKNFSNEAIVNENLARTYQQIGQTLEATKHWQQVTFIYRQLKNANEVGRSLAEQAQLYSSLAQPRKAIAILCNPDDNGVSTEDSVFQIAHNKLIRRKLPLLPQRKRHPAKIYIT